MRGKISLETVLCVLAFLLAIFAVVWSTASRSTGISKTLDQIEKNTEKLPQINSVLEGIKINTNKLPDMAAQIRILFDKEMFRSMKEEFKKGGNPEALAVCEKLLPERIKKEVLNIVKENIDKSDDRLIDLLIKKLDFSQIVGISDEMNVSSYKCAQNIARYAKNLKVELGKSK